MSGHCNDWLPQLISAPLSLWAQIGGSEEKGKAVFSVKWCYISSTCQDDYGCMPGQSEGPWGGSFTPKVTWGKMSFPVAPSGQYIMAGLSVPKAILTIHAHLPTHTVILSFSIAIWTFCWGQHQSLVNEAGKEFYLDSLNWAMVVGFSCFSYQHMFCCFTQAVVLCLLVFACHNFLKPIKPRMSGRYPRNNCESLHFSALWRPP